MHLISTETGAAAKKEACTMPPFGPGFGEDVRAAVEKLEVWGTKASNPGPDYCEFRAFDAQGKQIGTKRVDGY